MLNLNRQTLSLKPINQQLNALIEASVPPNRNERRYLGASIIGGECLRRIQFDWLEDAEFPARIEDVFERGHFFEGLARRYLLAVGFQLAPAERLKFSAVDGLFRGHADRILLAGPALPEVSFPCLWEHKALQAKSWRAIERDGLVGLHRVYAAQVAIYQAYLDIADNPCLFTVTNCDSCERLHFLVPFDAELAQMTSDRAVNVIQATRAGEILPRITNDSNDWRCKMCSHWTKCWQC
jgi:hypothetical protein